MEILLSYSFHSSPRALHWEVNIFSPKFSMSDFVPINQTDRRATHCQNAPPEYISIAAGIIYFPQYRFICINICILGDCGVMEFGTDAGIFCRTFVFSRVPLFSLFSMSFWPLRTKFQSRIEANPSQRIMQAKIIPIRNIFEIILNRFVVFFRGISLPVYTCTRVQAKTKSHGSVFHVCDFFHPPRRCHLLVKRFWRPFVVLRIGRCEK